LFQEASLASAARFLVLPAKRRLSRYRRDSKIAAKRENHEG
jgi:hypothetical protein